MYLSRTVEVVRALLRKVRCYRVSRLGPKEMQHPEVLEKAELMEL